MHNKQNVPFFFAVRYCLRGKKNFVALLCGIVLSIALLVISLNINQYSLLRQEESVLHTNGNWHVAYQLQEPSAQAKLDALPEVQNTTRCFFVPSLHTQAYAEPFQILGLEVQKLPSFPCHRARTLSGRGRSLYRNGSFKNTTLKLTRSFRWKGFSCALWARLTPTTMLQNITQFYLPRWRKTQRWKSWPLRDCRGGSLWRVIPHKPQRKLY